MTLDEKLNQIVSRHQELSDLLASSETVEPTERVRMSKEFAELGINNKEINTKIVKKETKKSNSKSYSIVVGTFKYRNNAKKQINLIKNKYPKTTNNKKSNIVMIKISGKQLYESRFENFSRKEAYTACKRLKKYKRDCFIRS